MGSLKSLECKHLETSDAEEEFRSCSADDEEWQDTEEFLDEGSKVALDEHSLRMFFKGVSFSEVKSSGSKVSGIGVVMERSPGVPILRVQKKLEFCVDESVAEHLALMDGLLEALQNGVRRVFAYTDSEEVYNQMTQAGPIKDQLLIALGERIMELADRLEDFVLELVPSSELQRPLRLAQEAVGFVTLSLSGGEDCSIRWRRCLQCEQLIEHIQGSFHMTCWCGFEFCSSCDAEYMDGVQTCQCASRDGNYEQSVVVSNQDPELWRWESFNFTPPAMDGYSEQERAQLALIQRFLAGGFEIFGQESCPPSPPHCSDSYTDTIKDLHQLPWLERFVSVISDSDNYQEEYMN